MRMPETKENTALIESPDRKPALPPIWGEYSGPDPAIHKAGDPAGLNVLTSALWRRKFTIAVAAILGVCAGLMATKLMPITYRARTSLQLEGFNDQVLQKIAPVLPGLHNASAENYLQNEVKLLQSETLAGRIADKLGIQPELRPPEEDLLARLKNRWMPLIGIEPPSTPVPGEALKEWRVKNVAKALTVRTSLQSQVIELFYEAPDPNVAALGANSAASEYISMNREARAQLVQDTTEWLGRQAGELKSKLERSNRESQEFAHQSGLLFTGNQSTPAQEQLRQTQEALGRAAADRASKQARFEAAAENPKVVAADETSSGPLRQYQEDLQKDRRELAELRTLYTPDHYKVKRLEAQAAETEAAIDQEHTVLLARLRADFIASANVERLLSESVAGQLKALGLQADNERKYTIQKSEIDTTQHLYDSILERVSEAGAASALRMTNIRVIDPAIPPATRYSPNPSLNLAVGFAIGTLGGVGVVLMMGLDNVRRPGVSALPNVPELGVVPSTSNRARRLNQGPGLVTGHQLGRSMLRESFRAVLTSILFSTHLNRNSSKRCGVVVVTSAGVMEGKTTVVTNLGIASAEMKRRVLLIDADLRRPRLHERFQLSNDRGLTELLEQHTAGTLDGSNAADNFLQPTHIPDLWVLTSGSGSASLLYSADVTAVLQHFQKQFDLVFIDTPPLMLYPDARVLGRISDGTVMVVRASTNNRDELSGAYRQLMQDEVPVMGTILNDWKMDAKQTRAYSRY